MLGGVELGHRVDDVQLGVGAEPLEHQRGVLAPERADLDDAPGAGRLEDRRDGESPRTETSLLLRDRVESTDTRSSEGAPRQQAMHRPEEGVPWHRRRRVEGEDVVGLAWRGVDRSGFAGRSTGKTAAAEGGDNQLARTE